MHVPRWFLTAFLCLGLPVPAFVLAADGPVEQGTPAPPGQRLAQTDDARQAQDLQRQIDRAWATGRFTDALGPAERLLALRQSAQGKGHWQTVSARWQVEKVRRTLAQPADVRRALAGIPAQERAAGAREARGQYREAQPSREDTLRLFHKALGEGHPDTATAYNNLANNLGGQGRFRQAQPLFEKALDVWRQTLGDAHPDTARGYSNLALNCNEQGRYAAAQPLFEKALAIWRKVLGEENPATATGYTGLAYNLHFQGRYARAQPLFEKALAIDRRVLGEDHPETAAGYNNLATILYAQGRYAQAQPLHEKALAIRRQVLGEQHPDTAQSYHNLAADLSARGKYTEAQPLVEKSLAVLRQVLGDDHPAVAQGYNTVAANLAAQGRYAAAQPLYEKALAVRRKALGEDHPDTAQSYNNLAATLDARGRYAQAQPLYEKALAACRKALGEDHPGTAACYRNLADNLNARGRYAEAEAYLTRAAAVFSRARLLAVSGGVGRAAVTAQGSPLPGLAAVLARNGKPEEAWRRFEESLARGTWDDLCAGLRRPPAERDRQSYLVGQLRRIDEILEHAFPAGQTPQLKGRQEALLTLRRRRADELAALTADLEKKYGPAAGQVYNQAAVQRAIRVDAALVGWIDIAGQPAAADPSGEHWAVVLRARGRPAWVRLRGTGAGGAWAPADDRLVAELRRSLPRPGGDWQRAARRLREQRLAPLAGPLAAHDGLPAARRLIVLPAPALAGLPLEVCAGGYTVNYAPSGTIFAYLRGRTDPPGGGLLAVADPVFDRPEPKGSRRPLLAQNRPGADDRWPELPGTRVEADGLATLCRQAGLPFRLLGGSDASEQELDRLAHTKELAGYRYIHLATHGVFDDRLPLQSAVILARDHLPDPLKQLEAGRPVYDGRLTAEEVLERWDLRAELVTLSACETALGKYEGGEGFVGFTQALLLSGARSVCLSLWKVDDTATALLMHRFYANLLGQRKGLKKPLGKAEALTEAKEWLSELSVEEAAKEAAALRQGVARGKGRKPLPLVPLTTGVSPAKDRRPYARPYYWAAFVLVGDGG